MHQFACPYCATRLRLKDKSFAGRTVRCPDCRRPVSIRLDPAGQLVGAPAEPGPAPGDPVTVSSPAASQVPGPPMLHVPRRRTVTFVAWGIAVSVLGLLLAFIFGERDAADSSRIADAATQTAPDPDPPPQPPEPGAAAAATPEAHLAMLARQVAEYIAAHGQFPAPADQPDLPPERRLSWLAALHAAQNGGGAKPQFNAAWDDPSNDRFVRQRMEAFQNPAIAQLTGAGGYPAGHFVGIAGVGADAPLLPGGHPRTGVFGYQRSTRVEDVKDGLSNTWMIAGAEQHIGSWAANGPATIRALTAEPYFRGPDGLGTGQNDGMAVLMADGSVRFLSRDTDPRLMRRMAAMADGLPLDGTVPGEPGEATPAGEPVVDEPEPEPPANADVAASEPIDVPLAEDPPLFDIEAALDQPIAEFDQSTPAPAGAVLNLVGEMAGMRVDTSALAGPDADRLQKPVTLQLRDTCVRAILDEAVRAAGLDYAAEEGTIVLQPAAPQAN